MELTVTSSKLEDILRSATSSTGSTSVSIKVDRKLLTVSSTKSGAVFHRFIKNDDDFVFTKSGEFSIDIDTLSRVLKSRSTLTFKLKDTELAFKATNGKYSGELSIMPYEEILVPKDNDDGVEMESELTKAILSMIKYVGITSIYDDDYRPPVLIRLKKKLLEVASYDLHHVAYTSLKVKSKKKLELAISPQILNVIEDVAEGTGKYDLSWDETTLIARNSSFYLKIGLLGVDSSGSINTILSVLDTHKKPDLIFRIDLEPLNSLLANSDAISDGEIPIIWDIQKRSAALNLTTTYGKMRDTIGIKLIKGSTSSKAFGIEPNIFRDTLNASGIKGEVELNINKAATCSFSMVVPHNDNAIIAKYMTTLSA